MLKFLLLSSFVVLAFCRSLEETHARVSPLHQFSDILGLVKLPQKFDQCDLNKMKACGQGFFQSIGYTGDPSDYDAFEDFVMDKLKTVAGFDNVCLAVSDADNCYGPGQSFIDCITVSNLMMMGLNQNSATGFAILITELSSECGNQKVFDDNYTCKLKVWLEEQQNGHLEKCVDTFKDQIKKDPQGMCKYGQEFIDCLADPYATCGSDLQNAMCEMSKAGFEKVMPCKFVCGKISPLSQFNAILASINLPQTAQCDLDKLLTCLKGFYQNIGYTGDPTKFEEFEKFITEKLGTVAGFDDVCTGFSKAESCYGPPGFVNCITVENLVKLGHISKESASGFATMLGYLGVECMHQKVVHDNYMCIGKVWVEGQKSGLEKKCADTFQDQVKKDPQGLCKYAGQFLHCMTDRYSVCGEQVRQVMCAAMKEAFEKAELPCKLNCDIKA